MNGISLIIPLFNEELTVEVLVNSILSQERSPDEVVFVDTGSTDNTYKIILGYTKLHQNFTLIQAGPAMPGTARNIGAEQARYDWIAFTDAGIKLEKGWLSHMYGKYLEYPECDIIFGNFYPVINNRFEKCATIAYVPPENPDKIRGQFIASTLMKKSTWKDAGKFPDYRAAEDLIFMKSVEEKGFRIAEQREALVGWFLRPNLRSTYRKFKLYSTHNVWAGMERYWHFGVLRQYLFVFAFLLMGLVVNSYFMFFLPAWVIARVCKRFFLHRREFGLWSVMNIIDFLLVFIILYTIDLATFSGWISAFRNKRLQENYSNR